MKIGDKVHCLAGNIDRKRGVGAVGYITGFSRLSSHHPREAYVSNINGDSTEDWCGWFWVTDLKILEEA